MTRSRSALVRLPLSLLLVVQLIALPARANTISGVATTGNPSACYEDDLQTTIQNCIAANQAAPPPGNPGPFTRGYSSIVVITGQCYGGGMSGLTGIGNNVVVGAAAAAGSESNWHQSNGADLTTAKWLWLDKLIQELNSNANRNIKDVLDGVKTADPDPNASTPDPSTSAGGGTVKLGDPANTGVGSYHAVLFGGFQDPGADATSKGQNAATQKALDDMETALKNQCHVPAGNIHKMFPGTCDDLKNMIKAAWDKMNDNEQFILVLADHGAQCDVDKDAPVEPDPGTGGQKSSIDTPQAFGSPNVNSPRLIVDVARAQQPAVVRLNGQPLGTLPPSTGHQRVEFPIPQGLLTPVVGPPNLFQLSVAAPSCPVNFVSLSTGRVGPGSISNPAPGTSWPALVALVLALLALGGLVVTRRREQEQRL